MLQGLVNLAGNLDMVDGKTVDGVDVSALKSNLVTLTDDQTITAQTVSPGIKLCIVVWGSV